MVAQRVGKSVAMRAVAKVEKLAEKMAVLMAD